MKGFITSVLLTRSVIRRRCRRIRRVCSRRIRGGREGRGPEPRTIRLLEPQNPVTTFDVTSEGTHTFDSDSVPQVVFSRKSPAELVGTATGVQQEVVLETLVEVTYTWKFSLRRRPE